MWHTPAKMRPPAVGSGFSQKRCALHSRDPRKFRGLVGRYNLVDMGGEVWWGGGMGCGTVGGGVDKEGNKIRSVKINKN